MKKSLYFLFLFFVISKVFAQDISYFYKGELINLPRNNQFFIVYFDLDKIDTVSIHEKFKIRKSLKNKTL